MTFLSHNTAAGRAKRVDKAQTSFCVEIFRYAYIVVGSSATAGVPLCGSILSDRLCSVLHLRFTQQTHAVQDTYVVRDRLRAVFNDMSK